jgi:hypothetical protein
VNLVKEKLGGKLLATIDSGHDELSNAILTVHLGSLEVSIYTSQDDDALVVQSDCPTLGLSEHPTLRVSLNDTTLYDTNSEEESPIEAETGE